MRLLDRYLLRELLIPLGFCLGGFLVNALNQNGVLREQPNRLWQSLRFQRVEVFGGCLGGVSQPGPMHPRRRADHR